MIEIERADEVQVIRINRPEKKNALTDAMYVSMVEALEAGDEMDAVAVHMFAGAGGAFTAGNDIAEFMAFAEGGALGDGVVRFLRALPKVQKPLVAAVDGLAIGIGTTVLFHCDMVFASPQAVFKTPFLNLGLVPEAGSSLLAPRIMGHARAFELLCAGLAFSAEDALRAGIVNQIVPAAELEERALGLCEGLAAKPRRAMALARGLLHGERADVQERIETEIAAFGERLRSEEARAAFSAFLNRN